MRVNALVSLAALVTASNAYAYLDPGSSGFVVQTLLAAVLSSGFVIKSNWLRLKALFQRFLRRSP